MFRAALLVLFLSSGAHAQDTAPSGPSILGEGLVSFDWGVHCPAQPSVTEPAPDVASGQINLHARTPDFQWRQTEVPAAIGIGFGVALQVDPALLPPTATVTVIHPPYPESGITTERWESDLRTTTPGLNGFSFDHTWEMVLGPWILRAETPDQVIYEIAFEVVPADRYPEIILTCLGGALS